MEEDISPTSLNVTAESSSKFKLVVNAYGALLSPINTMKVINYETSKHQVKPDSTVKCFEPSIYYFVLILRKLRYVFSKE